MNDEDISREVADAARIRREINEATQRLDACKARIRTHATELRAQSPISALTVEIASPEGVCTVAFVKDRFIVSKNQTPEGLRSTLPEKLWSTLFEFKPGLKEDAGALFEALSKEDQRRLHGLLEFKPQEPRVVLPK